MFNKRIRNFSVLHKYNASKACYIDIDEQIKGAFIQPDLLCIRFRVSIGLFQKFKKKIQKVSCN